MRLKRKSRDLNKFLTHLDTGSKYWIGIYVRSNLKILKKIGFSSPLVPGERLLPPAGEGPACRRNANGYEIVHRDRPMETAYRQAEWHWKEFRGRYDTEDRSKIVDVPYQRYPRTEMPPYSVELEIRAIDDGVYVVAGPFLYHLGDKNRATNTANMFVELFKECEILKADMTAWVKTKVRHLNWELLPSGKNPWVSAQPSIQQIIERSDQGNQPVIQARFETIGEYLPEFVAVGRGGFDGYIVFGFPKKGFCILESRFVNNATYVINKTSWEPVSKLSKAEILSNDLHLARVIHRENWFKVMNEILRKKKTKGTIKTGRTKKYT
jgi:hypothetical protein